jgi:hypothetical protein
MMKKLLVFVLVLGLASMAMAVPVLRVDPQDAKDHYMPSDVITIQLYDEGDVIGIAVDAVVDGGAGGTADNPQTFHSAFTSTGPGTLNSDGTLVEWAWGLMTAYPPVATGALYSFEYHVPAALPSTWINITTMNDGGNMWYSTQVDYGDGTSYIAADSGELGVAIHVIPEPATIALLGLGGLLLRRRK